MRSDRPHRVLVRVELATCGSALLCGGLLALRPDGSLLGLPIRVLEGGPFNDWRLPGLLLAGFVGFGYLAAGAWVRWRYPHSRELSVLAGAGLILFEAVEWAWLGLHPLQAVFMVVGAAVVGLAVTPAMADLAGKDDRDQVTVVAELMPPEVPRGDLQPGEVSADHDTQA